MITHYDLFAGIGGNSIALEEVFYDEEIKHIFCEWESFPTAVLRQHWPDEEYWGDIADLVAHTERTRWAGSVREESGRDRLRSGTGRNEAQDCTIVTGGFPCQPFSAAGRRKGTADDRYKWPEMFEVIRNVKPDWVIAENVRGLVTWNEGMVLETVCSDLESEGYEVQPLIIPAVAVGAQHRRDRVWIIANRRGEKPRWVSNVTREEIPKTRGAVTDTGPQRLGEGSSKSLRPSRQESERQNRQYPDWQRNWQEVAFATCDDSMDDGLPRLVDGVPYSRAKWRKYSLKAYGNGIVPQIMMEIFKAIKLTATTEQKGEQ